MTKVGQGYRENKKDNHIPWLVTEGSFGNSAPERMGQKRFTISPKIKRAVCRGLYVQKLRASCEGCSQPVMGLQRGVNITPLSDPLISCQGCPLKELHHKPKGKAPSWGTEQGEKVWGMDLERQMKDIQQRMFRSFGYIYLVLSG